MKLIKKIVDWFILGIGKIHWSPGKEISLDDQAKIREMLVHDYFVILFALVVPGNPYRCAVCWVFYLPAFEGKLPTLSNKKPPAIAEGFRDPDRIFFQPRILRMPQRNVQTEINFR